MEEARHAKLDTFLVQALAAGQPEAAIAGAVDRYLEIGALLDRG